MKGGKQPGAGRPKAPSRPTPRSWRPDTDAQLKKYTELGGSRWLKRLLNDAISQDHKK